MTSSLLNSTALEYHVKSLISEPETTISRIESQIRDSDDLICEPERKTVGSLHATLGPILKLPTELFIEIFSLIVSDEWLDSYSRWDAILRLSQVCLLWIQIAHNIPYLWKKFPLIEGSMFWRFPKEYKAMIHTWIARSSPFPIPIHIHCYSPGTAALLKSLFSTANRWESLQLECNPYAASYLADLAPESLEMLESLHIEISDGQFSAVKAFFPAQRLRRATLNVRDTLEFPVP